MKKNLLLLLSLFFIFSCTNAMEELIQSEPEGDVETKAAVHPLDRSLTIPLWEYVGNTGKPYKDYYYVTAKSAARTIMVRGVTYTLNRQVGRIFENELTHPYRISQGWSNAITRWYSPTAKRHMVWYGMEMQDLYPETAKDYSLDGIIGYTPSYVRVDDLDQYRSQMTGLNTFYSWDIQDYRVADNDYFINSPEGYHYWWFLGMYYL